MSFTMTGTPSTGGDSGATDSPNTGMSISFCALHKCQISTNYRTSYDYSVQYYGYHHCTLPGHYHYRCRPGSSSS
jgi:hypothetical protein